MNLPSCIKVVQPAQCSFYVTRPHVFGCIHSKSSNSPAYQSIHPVGDLIPDIVASPSKIPQAKKTAITNLKIIDQSFHQSIYLDGDLASSIIESLILPD